MQNFKQNTGYKKPNKDFVRRFPLPNWKERK